MKSKKRKSVVMPSSRRYSIRQNKSRSTTVDIERPPPTSNHSSISDTETEQVKEMELEGPERSKETTGIKKKRKSVVMPSRRYSIRQNKSRSSTTVEIERPPPTSNHSSISDTETEHVKEMELKGPERSKETAGIKKKKKRKSVVMPSRRYSIRQNKSRSTTVEVECPPPTSNYSSSSDTETEHVKEMDLKGARRSIKETGARGGNPLPMVLVEYQPLNINVFENIQKSKDKLQRIKDQIVSVDRDYKRKKEDPIRSQLYIGLKKHFKVYKNDINRFRIFLPDMNDDQFYEFCQPRPGLEKYKVWDMKFKIQKLVRQLEFDHETSRSGLYSIINYTKVGLVANNHDKTKWRTYRLKGVIEDTETSDRDASTYVSYLKAYSKKIKEKTNPELDLIQGGMFNEDEPFNYMFFFNYKIFDNWTFLAIRKQLAPTNLTKPREEPPKKLRKVDKRKRQAKPVKETSETLYIASKPGFPHLFVNGSIADQGEDILNIVTKAVGYETFEEQRLEGIGLLKLVEVCNKTVKYPDLNAFSKEFRAKEKEMKKRGISYADSNQELAKQFEIAGFRGMVDNNEAQVSGVHTFIFKSDWASTELRFNGTEAEVTENIIELYNKGIIKSLHPFIEMRKCQSNTYTCPSRDQGAGAMES